MSDHAALRGGALPLTTDDHMTPETLSAYLNGALPLNERQAFLSARIAGAIWRRRRTSVCRT
jgi:hypothetical protein